MVCFNKNILLALIAGILLIALIYFLNRNNQQPVATTRATTERMTMLPKSTRSNPSKFDLQSQMSDSVMDELVNQYTLDSDLNYSPVQSDVRSDIRSDINSDQSQFNYKKRPYVRRTPADIEDLFDVEKMLPQETEPDWFDTEPLQTTKIKGNLIHPKVHMGINTVGNSLRNATHDIRGDIPNPKIHVSPWNMSTIEPDTNLKGFN